MPRGGLSAEQQIYADLSSGDGLTAREPIMLKGLSEPQAVYSLG